MVGSDILNKESGSVKGIGTTFGIAGGILLLISVTLLSKKLLNLSAISAEFKISLPLMFKQEVGFLFLIGLLVDKLISSHVFLEFD
jgi:hypothetical protein